MDHDTASTESTAAVSCTDMPPKKRHSTTCATFGPLGQELGDAAIDTDHEKPASVGGRFWRVFREGGTRERRSFPPRPDPA